MAVRLAGALLRGGDPPEKALPAFPWPVRAAVWLWSMPAARVTHWKWLRGPIVTGAGVSGGEAALATVGSPECAKLVRPWSN